MNTFELSTDRLYLHTLQQSDFDFFHALNTHPYVRKYLWDDKVIDESTARSILQKNDEHFENDSFGLWKITRLLDQKPIGYTGLWYFYDEPQPQLLYVLHPSFAGQGYAQEAAQAIIAYAFKELKFTYLLAATDEANTSSQQTAQAIGMKLFEKKLMDEKLTLFYRVDNPYK